MTTYILDLMGVNRFEMSDIYDRDEIRRTLGIFNNFQLDFIYQDIKDDLKLPVETSSLPGQHFKEIGKERFKKIQACKKIAKLSKDSLSKLAMKRKAQQGKPNKTETR